MCVFRDACGKKHAREWNESGKKRCEKVGYVGGCILVQRQKRRELGGQKKASAIKRVQMKICVAACVREQMRMRKRKWQ